MKKAIGIDIGGTNTKIGIISELGELLEFSKFPTREPASLRPSLRKSNKLAMNC